jgi:choline dehydrogenase
VCAAVGVDWVLLDLEHGAGGEEQVGPVVLAAGAYGSPGILLRSGIGPADALRAHGIPQVADLPVGEELVDHVGTGAGWSATDLLVHETAEHDRRRGLCMAQVTIERRSRSCPEGVCDLFVFPAIEPTYEISAAVFAMKPRSRGSVRLTARAPEAPLEIDHGFLRDPQDADVLAEGFEQLRQLAASDEVRRYAAREERPGSEVEAPEHVRASARGFFHPVATCAIGRVLDDRCGVVGFENLYVVDASAIPDIPRANTNLTTTALAERAAEWI